MAKQVEEIQTIPQTVPAAAQPSSRRVLKASPKARRHHAELVAEAVADIEAMGVGRKAAERVRRAKAAQDKAEAIEAERAIETAKAAAARQGVAVERDAGRGKVVTARDGLHWQLRKGKIMPFHAEAGLRFRADFELAQGGGLLSCLNVGNGGGSIGGGPTDAMLRARDRTMSALDALGTPILKPYVIHVAGMGRTLSDPVFGKDPKRADDHALPLTVALDLLARHYGMVS